MTTLITGGTGLLGANLAHLLAARGAPLRLLVRDRSDRRGLRGVVREEVVGDIQDLPSLVEAMRGVETVFHLAGAVRMDPFAKAELYRIHEQGTAHVVQAAQAAGVRRLIHVSSIATVGHGTRSAPATEQSPYNFEGHNPYHESKRAAERRALEANGQGGLEVVVANPGFVVGPYDVRPSSGQLLLMVARGLVHVFPSGGINFVNAQDVAEGLLRLEAHGRPGERYVLGGQNLSYRQFLTLAAEEAGVAPPRLPAPEGLLRAVGWLGDHVGRLSPELFTYVNTPVIQSLFLPAYVSSRKAEETLGYRPRDLRLGVREAYRWFQEEGYLPRGRPLTPKRWAGAT